MHWVFNAWRVEKDEEVCNQKWNHDAHDKSSLELPLAEQVEGKANKAGEHNAYDAR